MFLIDTWTIDFINGVQYHTCKYIKPKVKWTKTICLTLLEFFEPEVKRKNKPSLDIVKKFYYLKISLKVFWTKMLMKNKDLK